jgi:hypothetical protein
VSECCLSAGSRICRSTRPPDCHTASFALPGCCRLDSRTGELGGGTETREHRSPRRHTQFRSRNAWRACLCARSTMLNALARLRLRVWRRRRSVPPGSESRAAVAARQRDNRGVSDPDFAAPFFAPRPVRRGSLTPRMHVAVVRRNRAPSVTPPSVPPVSCEGPARTSSGGTRLSGFRRKQRS